MKSKIYAVLMLAGGLTLIIVCAVLASRHSAFMATAKPMTATITGPCTIRKSGRGARLNPDRWDYDFPVRYSIDGHTYENSASVHGRSQMPAGANEDHPEAWSGLAMPIIYDPAEPTHIEAASHATAASWTWGYGLGAVLAGLGAFRLARTR